jgi:hypothetical protein
MVREQGRALSARPLRPTYAAAERSNVRTAVVAAAAAASERKSGAVAAKEARLGVGLEERERWRHSGSCSRRAASAAAAASGMSFVAEIRWWGMTLEWQEA